MQQFTMNATKTNLLNKFNISEDVVIYRMIGVFTQRGVFACYSCNLHQVLLDEDVLN